MTTELNRVRKAVKTAILDPLISAPEFRQWRNGLQQALGLIDREIERNIPPGYDYDYPVEEAVFHSDGVAAV